MSPFVRHIVTRGYDTDARARVSFGTVARYFEHVRWETIREPAAGLGKLFADGGKIVIRAQQVSVLRPLLPREELSLELTLSKAGNTSLQFAHVARCRGEVVAQNHTVVVCLDARNKPRAVPDPVRAKVTPQPEVALAHIAEAPAMPAYSCDVHVRPSDLDALKHVNHARYIDYFDDVFQHFSVDSGAPMHTVNPAAVKVEYERETRIDPTLGPNTKLSAHCWPIDPQHVGLELFDLAGSRVARAMIRCE
jgi:acyl-CoA thioesterase FadM